MCYFNWSNEHDAYVTVNCQGTGKLFGLQQIFIWWLKCRVPIIQFMVQIAY